LIKDLIEDGLMRQFHGNQTTNNQTTSYTPEEKSALDFKTHEYYCKEWMKTILKIVPFTKPFFALID
jgi:hypothetical protein